MSRLFFLLFFLTWSVSYSQEFRHILSRNFHLIESEDHHKLNHNSHTSFLPLLEKDYTKDTSYGSWFYRKLTKEYFLQIDRNDYALIVNPVINLEIGKERDNNNLIWTNTRGIIADGRLGSRFKFYSSFLENQSVFPRYITNSIVEKSAWVIPGQGESRWSADSVFDYSIASGHFNYRFSKFSMFEFGTGKHFIGDGYRSLILSDVAFNYPYLRVQTNAGIFQYTNLYMEHMNLLSNPSQSYTYDKKYMSLHHLSANITDRLNIGIFESVVWENSRTPEFSGFDISYLNPIIFLRPVEYSLNSSDNVLIGMNLKFKINNSSHIYGQFVLDEYSFPDLQNGDGWWGNKYAYQFGCKWYHAFRIQNLIFQFENNVATPYTYSHSNVNQSYSHYFQSLAHPLGSNFNETLFLIDYKFHQFKAHFQFTNIKFGDKIPNDPHNYGNDIFVSSDERPSDYGVEMYQGNYSLLDYIKTHISYTINPKTNLILQTGIVYRLLENDSGSEETSFIFFGVKSDLFNRYYDY